MTTMTREEMNERPHKALQAALRCADGTSTSWAKSPEELLAFCLSCLQSEGQRTDLTPRQRREATQGIIPRWKGNKAVYRKRKPGSLPWRLEVQEEGVTSYSYYQTKKAATRAQAKALSARLAELRSRLGPKGRIDVEGIEVLKIKNTLGDKVFYFETRGLVTRWRSDRFIVSKGHPLNGYQW